MARLRVRKVDDSELEIDDSELTDDEVVEEILADVVAEPQEGKGVDPIVSTDDTTIPKEPEAPLSTLQEEEQDRKSVV